MNPGEVCAEYASNCTPQTGSLMGATPAYVNSAITSLMGDSPQTMEQQQQQQQLQHQHQHQQLMSPYGYMGQPAMMPGQYQYPQHLQQQQQQQHQQQHHQHYQSIVARSMVPYAGGAAGGVVDDSCYQGYHGNEGMVGASVHSALVRPCMKKKKSGIPPSRVLHLREVARFTLEKDLYNVFSVYGKIKLDPTSPLLHSFITFCDVLLFLHSYIIRLTAQSSLIHTCVLGLTTNYHLTSYISIYYIIL